MARKDEPWNQSLLRALEEDEEDASMVSVHSVDEDEERALLQDTVVIPPASTTQPQNGITPKANMSKIESVKDDGSTSYKNFDRLRYSIRSNKGHVTRWLDALRDVRTRLESGGGSQFDVDKAREILKKLGEKVDKVQSQLDELGATYPIVREVVEAQKDNIFQEAQPDINRTETAVNRYLAAVKMKAVNEAGAIATAPKEAGRSKVDDSIRPDKLSADHTPAEFDTWKRDFETYFQVNQMDKREVPEQRANLNKCLDDHLKKLLNKNVRGDIGVYGAGGCMDFLDLEFKRLYPLFARRKEFFSMRPDKGEDFRDFRLRLKEVGDMCELHKLTEEECYVYKYHTCINDNALKQHLLTIMGKPLKDIDTLIDAYFENMRGSQPRQERTMRTSHGRERGGDRDGRDRREFQRQKSKSPGRERQKMVKCHGCGLDNHIKRECPFKDWTCHGCGQQGHGSKHPVCKRKVNKTRRTERQEEEQEPPRHEQNDRTGRIRRYTYEGQEFEETDWAQEVENESGNEGEVDIDDWTYAQILASGNAHRIRIYHQPDERTPTLYGSFVIEGKKTVNWLCILDTGATGSVISENLAISWGFVFVQHKRPRPMFSVTGERMRCTGIVRCELTLKQKTGKKIVEFTVCADTHDEIIVSYPDLKRLGVLPFNWPNSDVSDFQALKFDRAYIARSITEATSDSASIEEQCLQAKLRLFEEFADVISDEISETPIKGGPMKIEFRDDIKLRPRKCSVARRVPVHQEKAAKQLLDDLISRKIISPVNHCTDWISPAFFVEKTKRGSSISNRLLLHKWLYQKACTSISISSRGC